MPGLILIHVSQIKTDFYDMKDETQEYFLQRLARCHPTFAHMRFCAQHFVFIARNISTALNISRLLRGHSAFIARSNRPHHCA